MECTVNIRTIAWIEEALVDAGISVKARIGERELAPWRGASIDSRGECAGRLFFALSGERVDGHDHVRDAFSNGAIAAVIDREDMSAGLCEDGIAHFIVPDTRSALQKLARSYRRCVDMRVIAITGSGGKTTTKEYAHAVIRTMHRVHSNPGNYNSTIGVPLTVLDTEEDAEYLVCEIGANQAGEIDFLADLILPDVGVITNIGDAHVGEFGSRDAIAAAKGELLDHIGETGHIVLPRDDDYFDVLRARAGGRVFTFGTTESSDYVVRDMRRNENGIAFTVNGEPFTVATLGQYHALNACVAAAVGEICGVALVDASRAIATVLPGAGRGKITTVAGVTVVDESYNASPASMALSLDMLAESGPAHSVAVLGDMAELGPRSEELHMSIGRHIAGAGIARVFWKGVNAGTVEKGIEEAKGEVEFASFENLESLADAVASGVSGGDVVLVKASRSCELDTFVHELIARLQKKN